MRWGTRRSSERYSAWPYEGYTDLVGADGGVLVLPSREGPWMLAVGVPENAASAELTWTILGADGRAVAQFRAQGIQAAPGVWRFELSEDATDWERERKRICSRIPGPRIILLMHCGFLTGMVSFWRNTPEGDTESLPGGE